MWDVTQDLPIEQLLSRSAEPVYGNDVLGLIEGSTVLVTGAGGSIGSGLVQQLLRLGARVVAVDSNEYALYNLELRLTGRALLTSQQYWLVDIRNAHELDAVFARFRPDMVFHAAALKQLPLLERSPGAGVLTNVLGTYNVARACVDHGVERLVNVSTDKAANPISVLGMTKRLAEMVVRAHAGQGTLVASVRFGNVFGSHGSFIETMAHQMRAGLPVTLTDPAMTRYFMTIPQACGLVIQAGAMANGGSTFVLNMGDSYSIADIIDRCAKSMGVEPRIIVTGQRPGEKLDETLFDPRETRESTRHPEISTVSVNDGVPLNAILELCMGVSNGMSADDIKARLRELTQLAFLEV